ncbi:MAG TPA: MarR family transcriptional regulator [Povalibacter sp.]|nr:MarR family transcriptional regulator [Povalibacter sp.]
MAVRHYDAKNFNGDGSIGHLLKVSHSLLHVLQGQSFAGHDLSFIQWLILLKLRENAQLTASELCRRMNHDNGALTRLLDQLEERGYITRHRSAEDRRVVELGLTAAGRRKAEEMLPLAVNNLNAALAGFSKSEFAELIRLLNKFIDNLKVATSQEAAP